ncbi:hypothetical protein [Blastomonas sp.]|jgi:hypothetical protein|uniref:hypothetical protein n=1 Tax=Blastomonas sp. TaxID=1909299 RepID=UPI0017B96818|nr:hypothetical protein [Blastomonas sp.]
MEQPAQPDAGQTTRDDLLDIVRSGLDQDAQYRARLAELVERASTPRTATPEPFVPSLIVPSLTLPIRLKRVAKVATGIAALNLPGATLALMDALRQQPTTLDLISIIAFTASIGISGSAWWLLHLNRLDHARARKIAQAASATDYRREMQSTSAFVHDGIAAVMIETGEMDARVQANVRLAEDIATLQPATEGAEDDRQARIASAKAETAALVREQHQALDARTTALEQSVLRCSGQI